MLAHLPPELYACILDYVADQQTVLALTRCLPYAGIPVDRLFRSICIRQPETVPKLYRRIRAKNLSDASHLVYHLSVETWHVDADVLTNLLRLLPNLRSLIVWIGPDNFSPEHLEEIFKPPMPNLDYLSLRFRPYVKKATYYQFHKGSYFDSTLLALSAWPASHKSLPALSIVQDPDPDPSPTAAPRFAQPIVFFRLDLHLSLLLHSHTSLTSLRIRIPSRPIVHPLTTSPSASPSLSSQLTFLDISTSTISPPDIDKLLISHPRLAHLILDACTGGLLRPGGPPQAVLLRGSAEVDWWDNLGRRVVLAGVRRAREREKALRAWCERVSRARGGGGEGDAEAEAEAERRGGERRAKRGRRGLASATIMFRDRDSDYDPPRTGPPGSVKSEYTGPLPPKVHVVPPLPVLRSIALSPVAGGMGMSPEARAVAREAFERGWCEGLRVLWEVRARMGTTFFRERERAAGGVRVGVQKARFLVFSECEGGKDREGEEGFEGLCDVQGGDVFVRDSDVHGKGAWLTPPPPVLCLVGDEPLAGDHEPGCGHLVGREVGMERLG